MGIYPIGPYVYFGVHKEMSIQNFSKWIKRQKEA